MIKLYRYRIRPELCRVCMACVRVCPEQAIVQLPDKTLKIDESTCTSCGACQEACNLRVIVREFSPHKR